MTRLRVRLWLLERLPDGLLARPGEWFLAFLCVFAGLSTLASVSQPTSLEQSLPTPFVAGWGLVLILGGLSLMCGLFSIKLSAVGAHVVTRIACYRFGLNLLGLGCLVYSLALLHTFGADGFPSSVPPLAFAGMCMVRLLTLGGRS